MSRYAGRRAAAQMERDGIRKLPRWSKGRSIGYATIQKKLAMPTCEHTGCSTKASYSTPLGNCCFSHAIAQASS